MKKLFITLLLSTILLTNAIAQQISATAYNKAIIHEDFNTEGDFFPIVTTTDNYFIIDKGDYLLSRNNEDSEYAIIASNSSANNFVLKTSVRIGPSNKRKASVGIIIKSQQDDKGAIIFEINKKREYRIRQLQGNTYTTLSGSSKQEGWVRGKTINGVDEHNVVEIRTEKNIYDVYVNSNYLTTFFIPDYASGSCGIMISPGTKARIAYYYINTKGGDEQSAATYTNANTTNVNSPIEELNKKIETLEKNNATLNNVNTKTRENQDEEIRNLTQKNADLAGVTIEQEQEIASLQRSITDLKSNNSKIEELEKTISDNTTLISELNTEKNTFSNDVATLTETITRLNTKNTELASITIEQEKEVADLKNNNSKIEELEKTISNNTAISIEITIEQEEEIASLQKSITDLKNNNSKIEELEKTIFDNTALISELNTEKNTLTNDVATLTKTTTGLNTKNTDLASVTIEQEQEIKTLSTTLVNLKSKNTELTNNLNKVNKSSNSRITQLTTEINSLQSAKTTLTADLRKEKNAHAQTKNGLSKSVTNKEAKIKELTNALNNAKQQLKSANKTSANLKKCATNSANLSAELKQANNELSTLKETQTKHDKVTTGLNSNITDLNSKIEALKDQLRNADTKLTALNTTNTELKKLFFLKDFEINGVKPSDLTKQTNTYPTPKEIKGNRTIYAVQFGVYMQVQPYSALKGLDEVWYETTEYESYVYLSGQFKSPQEATEHKNSLIILGYPNAFVVTLTK